MFREIWGAAALGSVLAGGLALSGAASAQPGPAPRDGHRGGLFAMADANKDGKVSKAEFTAALDARFVKLDANHDGKLTQEDRDLARQKRLDERFARLDADKNGQISKAEFLAGHQARGDRDGGKREGREGRRHHGLGKAGMFGGFGRHGAGDGPVTRAEFLAKPLAMFDRADADKDGFVTAEEMQAARQAARQAWQSRRGGDAPRN